MLAPHRCLSCLSLRHLEDSGPKHPDSEWGLGFCALHPATGAPTTGPVPDIRGRSRVVAPTRATSRRDPVVVVVRVERSHASCWTWSKPVTGVAEPLVGSKLAVQLVGVCWNFSWLVLQVLLPHGSRWNGPRPGPVLEAYYEGQLDEKQIVIHKGSGGPTLRAID